MLFIFREWYPAGGMDDFELDFDKKQDALLYIEKNKYKYGESFINYHIYDTTTRNIIFKDLINKI